MSAVPITSSAQAGRVEPAATDTFQRAAGIAGLVAVAGGLAAALAGGSVPGLGTSPAKIAAYFAANSSAHKTDVVLSVLIAVPVTMYMIGVYRTLAAADRTRNGPWPMMFLYGAVMMSATADLQETLYAVLALRGGAGLASGILRAVNDAAQISGATLGIWITVAVGAVAAATFTQRVRARWYGWFCTIAAILSVLAVIDTVSTSTGGIFANAAFAVGVVLWATVTSILMLRRNT